MEKVKEQLQCDTVMFLQTLVAIIQGFKSELPAVWVAGGN